MVEVMVSTPLLSVTVSLPSARTKVSSPLQPWPTPNVTSWVVFAAATPDDTETWANKRLVLRERIMARGTPWPCAGRDAVNCRSRGRARVWSYGRRGMARAFLISMFLLACGPRPGPVDAGPIDAGYLLDGGRDMCAPLPEATCTGTAPATRC